MNGIIYYGFENNLELIIDFKDKLKKMFFLFFYFILRNKTDSHITENKVGDTIRV